MSEGVLVGCVRRFIDMICYKGHNNRQSRGSLLPGTIKMPRGAWLWLFKSVVEVVGWLAFLDHVVAVRGGVHEGAGHRKDV